MTREVAQGNSLAGGEELVTGSKVPSDLLQLEIRTFSQLGVHAFILRIPLHVYDAQLFDLKSTYKSASIAFVSHN